MDCPPAPVSDSASKDQQARLFSRRCWLCSHGLQVPSVRVADLQSKRFYGALRLLLQVHCANDRFPRDRNRIRPRVHRNRDTSPGRTDLGLLLEFARVSRRWTRAGYVIALLGAQLTLRVSEEDCGQVWLRWQESVPKGRNNAVPDEKISVTHRLPDAVWRAVMTVHIERRIDNPLGQRDSAVTVRGLLEDCLSLIPRIGVIANLD